MKIAAAIEKFENVFGQSRYRFVTASVLRPGHPNQFAGVGDSFRRPQSRRPRRLLRQKRALK